MNLNLIFYSTQFCNAQTSSDSYRTNTVIFQQLIAGNGKDIEGSPFKCCRTAGKNLAKLKMVTRGTLAYLTKVDMIGTE